MKTSSATVSVPPRLPLFLVVSSVVVRRLSSKLLPVPFAHDDKVDTTSAEYLRHVTSGLRRVVFAKDDWDKFPVADDARKSPTFAERR